MAEKLNIDMSLDDIIKISKKKKTVSQPNTQRLKKLAARSKIVRNKGGPRQQQTRQQQNQQQQQASPKREPTLLHVSNLHYNVNDDDVRTLFAEVGPVKKAAVHYDKSGRSLGTAEVLYTTRDSAMRAMKKYHQLLLDGRPMIITLVPNQNQQNRVASSAVKPAPRIGIKAGSGISKAAPRKNTRVSTGRVATGGIRKAKPTHNNNNNNNNNNKGRRQPKPQVTAEDLDDDLEAYRKKKL